MFPDSSAGDLAGSKIYNDVERERTECRDAEGNRVSRKFPLMATERGDVSRTPAGIRESHENHALRGCLFRPFTEATQMGTLPNADDRHAVFAGCFDAGRCGCLPRQLPKSQAPVYIDDAPGQSLNFRFCRRVDCLVSNHLRIQWEYANAVTAISAQIGLYQGGGDL